MKKTSASQSAFFNLRVSIGVFTVPSRRFSGACGSGALSATAQSIMQAMQKGKTITSPRILSFLLDLIVPRFTTRASINKKTYGREPL
jgi:hypothetical protein